jgi:glyoxylase-like metal-dependent hydrolase (beta-lactamase superfamily II)
MIDACHILDTGACLASESHLIQGGVHRTVECPSQVGLLHHTRHGWFLFDTGYAPRIVEAARRFPYPLYLRATPLRLRPQQEVIAQLPRFGLTSADIQTVILSHFHADHVAGLLDFPQAQIVCARSAWEDVRGRAGFPALRRAFLPDLVPADMMEHAILLDDFTGPDLGPLGPIHDLFGDGSARLVALPGHAVGQIGLYVITTNGPVLFVTDAVYRTRQITECIPSHPVTNLFIADSLAARRTLVRLHEFASERGDVRFVVAHEGVGDI